MAPHKAAAADKLPAVDVGHTHSPDRAKHDLERTTSITQDADGNTVINREDGEVFVIDRKAERALVWKFDLRILPLLALMYLFNALDKANLGNAKTAGEYLFKLYYTTAATQYRCIISALFHRRAPEMRSTLPIDTRPLP